MTDCILHSFANIFHAKYHRDDSIFAEIILQRTQKETSIINAKTFMYDQIKLINMCQYCSCISTKSGMIQVVVVGAVGTPLISKLLATGILLQMESKV